MNRGIQSCSSLACKLEEALERLRKCHAGRKTDDLPFDCRRISRVDGGEAVGVEEFAKPARTRSAESRAVLLSLE